jgi:hypothetical protein
MVSQRTVGRPSKGEVAQQDSRTALRAHVACKLAGRCDDAFLTGLGVTVNTTAVRRAGGAVTWHPPGYVAPGRQRTRAPAASRPPALREWLAIDYEQLDISLAAVTLRAKDDSQQLSLYAAVCDIPGALHTVLFVPADEQPTVMAIVAWDGEADARRLRNRFRELDASWSWQPIDVQTTLPAQATWRHLTIIAADAEGLHG